MGADVEIFYRSTRGGADPATASAAILKGLAQDGGLFVPEAIPALDKSLKELAGMSYQEVAYEVLKLFLTDFTEEELKDCIRRAYDEKFDTREIAPLAEVDGAYYLELFHGATLAFKDMALSILPHLLTAAARKNRVSNQIVILTATSGDTGKAALAGFADVEGTKILVFYPKNGVSPIQERQMVTQKGANAFVAGIHGNFDDAQTGVKKIFSDQALAKEMEERGYQFSSANSINIGRLAPQIVYYVYAYARLLAKGKIEEGEPIHAVVPTGNFGNILAAYYAGKMGLPIGKLLCASNENKVLYDFFRTGAYDRNREFVLTSSPSMDILISSNLERLIYHAAGNDGQRCARFMAQLSGAGQYEITRDMLASLSGFYGNYATQGEASATIRRVFEACGYVMDTHTAVAASVYEKYRKETGDRTKAVVVSTASPFKFVGSVMKAIAPEEASGSKAEEFALIDRLSALAHQKIPAAMEEIRLARILHSRECEIEEMPRAVREFLRLPL
ncbi:MAG: threonine synthase [Clostridium sp.]|jgi:threonine synthase|nr:threonine synthase [Clostridium sp.]